MNLLRNLLLLALVWLLTACASGVTNLHNAAAFGSITRIDHQLASGLDINLVDSSGRTPLHFAVFHRRTGAVEHLLRQGANVNARDKNGQTPLFYAVHWNSEKLIQVLINNGADLEQRDNDGNTVLMQTVCGYSPDGTIQRNAVISRLVAEGADVSASGGKCSYATVSNFAAGQRPLSYAFVQQGLRRRQELQAARENIDNLKSIADCRAFLAQYPDTSVTSLVEAKLAGLLVIQRQEFEAAKGRNRIADYKAFLAKYPDSEQQPEALAAIAALLSKRADKLARYAEYSSRYPDFLSLIPEEDKLYYVGPTGMTVLEILQQKKRGNNPSALAARISASKEPYKNFSPEEIDRLQKMGLTSGLIDAMIASNSMAELRAEQEKLAELQQAVPVAPVLAPAPAAAAPVAGLLVSVEPQAEQQVTDAIHQAPPQPILGNSGAYMCPYTQDGVLAKWTDMMVSAKIGTTAGSVIGTTAGAAIGKEVGDQLLDSVPFGGLLGGIIGGAIGGSAGKKAGKKMGLEAAGGMANVRKTSDLSFNSLDEMARYLQANHADHDHFQEALNATNEIYPGFLESFKRVSKNI